MTTRRYRNRSRSSSWPNATLARIAQEAELAEQIRAWLHWRSPAATAEMVAAITPIRVTALDGVVFVTIHQRCATSSNSLADALANWCTAAERRAAASERQAA